jgi:hypothetical protein
LNFTFRYIDDVLSLNNSRFCDFVDRIYPIELEIKDTTDTDRSASYLDIHLEIELRTKLYDKRDDLNLPIVNFPFICSNIPARRGAQFVPIGMPTVCWKTRLPNIANMLSIKNSSMLKISVLENFLVESEWCFTK